MALKKDAVIQQNNGYPDVTGFVESLDFEQVWILLLLMGHRLEDGIRAELDKRWAEIPETQKLSVRESGKERFWKYV